MDLVRLYYKKNKVNTLSLLGLALISAGLSYQLSQALGLVFKQVKDQVGVKEGLIKLVVLYGLMFLVGNLKTLFYNRGLYQGKRNLSLFSLGRLYRTDYSYFVSHQPKALVAEVGMAAGKLATYFTSLNDLLALGVQAGVYLYILYRVDLLVFIMALAFIPLILCLNMGIKKKMSYQQDQFRQDNMKVFSQGLEALELSEIIKARRAQDYFHDRLKKQNQKANKSILAYGRLEAYSLEIMTLLTSLGVFVVLYGLKVTSRLRGMGADEIMLVYLFLPMTLTCFNRVYKTILDYFASRPYLRSFKTYLDLKAEVTGQDILEDIIQLETKSLLVTLGDEKKISIPDMVIKKGEKIMIKGPSGVGKSTFFSLLVGLQTTYKGQVLINGRDLRTYDMETVRGLILMAFQEAKLYHMDLEDNLVLGGGGDVNQVIDLCQLRRLQEERGGDMLSRDLVSGGEKSRMSIGRAMMRQPSLLLLDESTSSLDQDLEENLLRSILKAYPDLTLVCISHRPATEKFFDRVIEF